MWVITPELGFVSVVAHRDDPGKLIVRARAREDLVALVARIGAGQPEIVEHGPGESDYPFRIFVTRAQWGSVLLDLAASIDYDNMKNRVLQGPDGSKRFGIYTRVWTVLRSLMPSEYHGR